MSFLNSETRKRLEVIIIHTILLILDVLNSNNFEREHMTSSIYNFDAELK